MKKFKISIGLVALALSGFLSALVNVPLTARAETKLTLVYPFPDFLIYTKNCKALATEINKRGKGVVQIEKDVDNPRIVKVKLDKNRVAERTKLA